MMLVCFELSFCSVQEGARAMVGIQDAFEPDEKLRVLYEETFTKFRGPCPLLSRLNRSI
jgi:hypothetical protein